MHDGMFWCTGIPSGFSRRGVGLPDPLLAAVRHARLQGCVPLAGQGVGQLLAALLKSPHNLHQHDRVKRAA